MGLLVEVQPGPNHGVDGNLVTLGNEVLFEGTTTAEGSELWITDGTAAGTRLVVDLYPGFEPTWGLPHAGNPSDFFKLNGQLFFTANDGLTGIELWTTNGTALGTTQVVDLNLVVDPTTGNSRGDEAWYATGPFSISGGSTTQSCRPSTPWPPCWKRTPESTVPTSRPTAFAM